MEDLQLLLALASAGSLAGAARELDLNHANAWRRLGALEARLGARLFERTRTGYAATPAGEEAIAMAERVLAELDETTRRLLGQDIRPTGTVRLTTTESLFAFIAPALKALRASHPGVLVEVVIANAFFTLTRRDADIALRPAAAVADGLVARRLATIASRLYAAPTYLDATAERDPLKMDWLALDDSLAHLPSARWMTENVSPDRIVHRTNSLLALRDAARAGLGVAVLPCFMVPPAADLRPVAPPIAGMANNLWLITHPDLRRMPRVRAVMDAIAGHLNAHEDELEGRTS